MHISLDSALGRQRRLNSVGESVLQIAPDAAAAYSLRSLTGGDPNVVRVRRESDNTEKDFSGSQIESGEMARWVNEQPTLPLDLRELDTNTGERDGALIEADAAYSLRKLKKDFTGDVVQVRRNVDGETEGFTADEVTDGTLENFVSTGEVVYSSDFSVDANNVIHNVGETKLSVTGNNDGISDGSVTKDNVLKVENIGDVPAAPQLRINTDEYEDSTKGSVTFTYYVPTGHPIVGNYWHIGASLAIDGTETSYSPTGVQIVGGAWTTATVAYENKLSTKRFLTIIDEEVADGTASAFIPEGDVGDFYYISEIKVYRNEELGLPLDQATGAAAAYSLRNLKASGTDVTTSGDTAGDTTGKYVVQTRRSSDDAVKSFTASEVADGTLEDWVNTELTTYTSDFSEDTDGWTATASSLSVSDEALVLVPNTSLDTHFTTEGNLLPTGKKLRVTYDVKIPSGQSIVTGFKAVEVSGVTLHQVNTQTQGEFVSYSAEITPVTVGGSLRFFARSNATLQFSGDDSEKLIIKNIVVTVIDDDGFVRTWYDQSGSDNDAVQTTPANQPKIVNAGTYLEEVDFDGTQYFTTISSGILTDIQDTFSTFVGTRRNSSQGYVAQASAAGGTNPRLYLRFNAATIGAEPVSVQLNGINDQEALFTLEGSSGVYNGYNNGANTTGSVTTATTGARAFTLGASSTGATALDGKLKEFIIYDSDQSTKRRAIEENIANHYGISLAAFSRDGTVSTWYDQSGNTNDATQTDPTKQPAVVLNGDLQKDSLDNPAVKFDNSNDHLANTSFSSQIEGPLTIFAYSDRNGDNGNVFSLTGDADLSGRYFSIYQNADTSQFVARAITSQTISQAGFTGTDARLTTVRTTSDVSYSVGTNGNTFATGTADYGNFPTGNDLRRIVIGKLREGATTGDQVWGGYIAEIIVYSGATHGDQSANRTAIEANIGEHYNITAIPAASDTVNGFVQTWYDQSGNVPANDAVQTTASYQPKIVDSGALVTRNINGTVSPSIKFGASNKMYHGITSLSADGQQSLFFVADNQVTSGDSTRLLEIMSSTADEGRRRRPLIFKDLNQSIVFSVDSLDGIRVTAANSDQVSTYSSITKQQIISALHTVYQDGTQVGSATVTLDANPTLSTSHEEQLGNLASNAVGNFYFTEIVYYNSDQTDNRTAIETNIANQYGITLS